jgi:ABC-type polysaccharide/polyol phosphate transport system ATPase subunit
MSSESTYHAQAHSTEQPPAIQANELSKTYHIYKSPSDRLKQLIWGHKTTYYEPYHALSNITFDLPKGEVLGIVGRNGAGKSTLLQLLCGTLTPSSGGLKINGRIAALLELGAGFNPQFTGRENIYLSATVMGITQQEIDEKLENIIEFSGIRPFIDQPVTTYSSGMYVRLAFSVATSVNPDILIIDEALSVGDGDFARRSFERIMTMRDSGKTILFCSHSLYQVEALCTRAIWIEKGEIRASGKPEIVIPSYQSFLDRLGNEDSRPEQHDVKDNEPAASIETPLATANIQQESNTPTQHPAPSTNSARITKVVAYADGISGSVLNVVSCTSHLKIDIEFYSSLTNETPGVALAIHSAGGQLVTSCGSWSDGLTADVDENGIGRVSISYKEFPLLKGTYYVGILLFCSRGIFLHDEADPAITLHVQQSGQERGLMYIPHQWEQSKKKNLAGK